MKKLLVSLLVVLFTSCVKIEKQDDKTGVGIMADDTLFVFGGCCVDCGCTGLGGASTRNWDSVLFDVTSTISHVNYTALDTVSK